MSETFKETIPSHAMGYLASGNFANLYVLTKDNEFLPVKGTVLHLTDIQHMRFFVKVVIK